jgi:nucleoside-diphosphate-sugar epimerase
VEDAAAACILLGRSPDAAAGENPVWHVPGAEPTTGRAFIERAFKVAGAKPNLGVRSRFFVQALGALVPTAKELAEVLYEFETPTLMDGGKLLRAFPDFRYTPYEDGLPQAVDWTREHLGEIVASRSRAAGSQPAGRRAG